METIFKYPISITDEFVLKLPKNAKVLTVQSQFINVCIWVLVDPKEPLEDRRFKLYGTGHPVAEVAFQEYVGTFQIDGGLLVFHLFEWVG